MSRNYSLYCIVGKLLILNLSITPFLLGHYEQIADEARIVSLHKNIINENVIDKSNTPVAEKPDDSVTY